MRSLFAALLTLALFAGCSKQDEPPPVMEYNVGEFGRGVVFDALNDYGAEGWRIVAAELDDREPVWHVILERVKEDRTPGTPE